MEGLIAHSDPPRQEALRIAKAFRSVWLQQARVDGQVKVDRVDTMLNSADLGTRFLEAARRKQLIGMLLLHERRLSEWWMGGVRRMSCDVDVDVDRASREWGAMPW